MSPSSPAPPVSVVGKVTVSNNVPLATHLKTKAQASSSTENVSNVRANTSIVTAREEQPILSNNFTKPQKRAHNKLANGEQTNQMIQIPSSNQQDCNVSVSPVPSNQNLYDNHMISEESRDKESLVREENLWNSENDWDGIDLVYLSRYSTDDDKISEF